MRRQHIERDVKRQLFRVEGESEWKFDNMDLTAQAMKFLCKRALKNNAVSQMSFTVTQRNANIAQVLLKDIFYQEHFIDTVSCYLSKRL